MYVPALNLPNPDEIYGANFTPQMDASLEPYLESLEDCSKEDLANFRWKLGHQMTALLYALSIRDLTILKDQEHKEEADNRVAAYLKASNALFQYTVSMDAETYKASIRKNMAQHHTSFSAVWWKEAQAFKKIALGLKNQFPQVSAEMREFWKLHKNTGDKMGISTSLLQDHKEQAVDVMGGFYFDSYFLINRTSNGESELLNQLELRAALLKNDINNNSLVPDALGLS